jgi:hypothetical protein
MNDKELIGKVHSDVYSLIKHENLKTNGQFTVRGLTMVCSLAPRFSTPNITPSPASHIHLFFFKIIYSAKHTTAISPMTRG